MASKSSIEWTEFTWNPITGCSKISIGCNNCYAERMAKRLQAMGNPNYSKGFKLSCHEHVLEAPLKWKKPHMIFVNSMSDTFHEDVPDDFLYRLFDVMNKTPQHTYQILTKRSKRMLEISSQVTLTPNIWMGVTVESEAYLDRIDDLREVAASVRFLSLEPLLSPLGYLNLDGIGWVIVGGESGPGARPMNESWVKGIRDISLRESVPFFFKQWGGVNKKKAGRALEGRTWDEMPSPCNDRTLLKVST